MKGLRVLGMLFLTAAIALFLMEDAAAETRTLTTRLIITVRAKTPEITNAPQQVQELLGSALSTGTEYRFVKLESPSDGPAIAGQRYTMMEKL